MMIDKWRGSQWVGLPLTKLKQGMAAKLTPKTKLQRARGLMTLTLKTNPTTAFPRPRKDKAVKSENIIGIYLVDLRMVE
jgi:hypothetical protein